EVVGDGDVVVQIIGDDSTVVVGHAQLHLTRYLGRRLAGRPTEARSEAELLSPYALSVPLVGRELVLADLWRGVVRAPATSGRGGEAGAGAGGVRPGGRGRLGRRVHPGGRARALPRRAASRRLGLAAAHPDRRRLRGGARPPAAPLAGRAGRSSRGPGQAAPPA